MNEPAGSSLTIELQVKVWHPYAGEAIPRESATAAMYEIEDGVKAIVEKHGLSFVACSYGVKGKR